MRYRSTINTYYRALKTEKENYRFTVYIHRHARFYENVRKLFGRRDAGEERSLDLYKKKKSRFELDSNIVHFFFFGPVCIMIVCDLTFAVISTNAFRKKKKLIKRNVF